MSAQTPADSVQTQRADSIRAVEQRLHTLFDQQRLDSLYIVEVEDRREPDKVLHAEPLYIDLIRDLGARKGEREWNVGLGLTDHLDYNAYEALVEYEFAPINRLGLEIEVPITIYTPNERNGYSPANRVESLKLAAQWSFLVSERAKTTLALGYINELKLVDANRLFSDTPLKGNKFNPFFIAAKRWGDRFHTLLYTGPQFTHLFQTGAWHRAFEINTNFHYMIPGTRNFVGVEVNKELYQNQLSTVFRPQLRVSITDNLLIGIVTGIPSGTAEQRLSSFMRLIYEPGHGHRPHRSFFRRG